MTSALHLIKTQSGASWAFRQIRELIDLGVKVSVMLPEGEMAKKYRDLGVEVVEFRYGLSPLGIWRRIKRFRRLVKYIKPDVVHCHFFITMLWARLLLRSDNQIIRIFQVPGPLHLEYRLYRWLDIALSQENDYWIASCEWVRNRYLGSHIEPGHIGLSYYGVDLDSYSCRPTGKLRKILGIGEDVYLIGMVCFAYAPKKILLQSRGLKGHEDFIDAISEFSKSRPDTKAVIIGGAWLGAEKYFQGLQEYARKKCGDSLIFLGTRNDVPELYPDLNIAVHPSLSENVGAAVESYLSCVPTISTRVGGLVDLVKQSETGYLVSPGSPKEIVAALEASYTNRDKSKIMTAKGNKLAKSLLNVRDNAKQINSYYNAWLDK